MRDSWRHFVAEFIGILAFVFVGGASIMSATMSNLNPLLPAAIAHGLILGIMVTATMRISGHLNPAVTIGFMVTKRIEPMMGVVYIIAQLLGAAVAAYALKAVFPVGVAEARRLGG
jgi:glycerol uptake facilitator-like aquaporin